MRNEELGFKVLGLWFGVYGLGFIVWDNAMVGQVLDPAGAGQVWDFSFGIPAKAGQVFLFGIPLMRDRFGIFYLEFPLKLDRFSPLESR
ncbi:MAG: hypothetical protein MUF24_10650 [Chitinophagaceae bacterium]|jgi:hypothetical protein|nr:hypothetical protein [Chitinophagaceae bacterium]